MSDLLDKLTAKPTAPAVRARGAKETLTSKLELTDGKAVVEVKASEIPEPEGSARDVLEANGLDPADWAVSGMRSSNWTMANGEEGTSVRFTFVRRPGSGEVPNLDELLTISRATPPAPLNGVGEYGVLIPIGDMQFGKIDGDGAEGTIKRAVEYIDLVENTILALRPRFNIGHIHIAWLGDHIEGFTSQGGANVWRTQLTLNEQIRVTRRIMFYALERFAPLAHKVTMAAVPGNHGEPQRFAGKGITRYDDSHDTESLIAVSEAAAINPHAFGHVQFFVPETDEMTVVLDVAGTRVGHVHGHQFRPGKHFDWWEGQAFGESALRDADLLLAGHLHHFLHDTNGRRSFIQVPSLELESTWFRHRTGIKGHPGIVVAITKDGTTSPVEVVR